MKTGKLNIGFDIGSVSINAVICDAEGRFVEEMPYHRHFGRTLELVARILGQIEDKYGRENIQRVAFTGTPGESGANRSGACSLAGS